MLAASVLGPRRMPDNSEAPDLRPSLAAFLVSSVPPSLSSMRMNTHYINKSIETKKKFSEQGTFKKIQNVGEIYFLLITKMKESSSHTQAHSLTGPGGSTFSNSLCQDPGLRTVSAALVCFCFVRCVWHLLVWLPYNTPEDQKKDLSMSLALPLVPTY